MKNVTLTKNKRIAIFLATAFVLNKALAFIGHYIAFTLSNMRYDELEESTLLSSFSNTLMNASTLAVNLITAALLIFLGKKLTENKTGAVLFLGCYYFGSAAGGLLSSFVSSLFKTAVTVGISASVSSAIINISSFVSIFPAFFVAYMAFTAFMGTNPKLPATPSTVSLKKARKAFIIVTVLLTVIGGTITTLPNLLLALINPESGSFIAEALVYMGYFAAWFSSLISFAAFYLTGYKITKSHFGAISFYILANAISVPVTAILGNITSIAMNISQHIILESGAGSGLPSVLPYAMSAVTSVTGILSVIIGFIISYKALSLFFTDEVYLTPVTFGNEAV